MEQENFGRIKKLLLRNHYESLFNQELVELYIRYSPTANPLFLFVSFIFSIGTTTLSVWCSSGDTSYLPSLFSERPIVKYVIISITPIILLIILVWYCVKYYFSNTRFIFVKKIYSDVFLKQLLKKFIKEQLKNNEIIDLDAELKTCQSINEIFNKCKESELIFTIDEFVNYTSNTFKNPDQIMELTNTKKPLGQKIDDYKLDVSSRFYYYIANYILLDKDLDSTLIFNPQKTENTYGIIIKNNERFFHDFL